MQHYCIHTTSTTPDLESDFPLSHPWVCAGCRPALTSYHTLSKSSAPIISESQPYNYTYKLAHIIQIISANQSSGESQLFFKLSHIIQPITSSPSNPSAAPIISGESQTYQIVLSESYPTHPQPQSSAEKVKPGCHLPTYQVTTYKATPHYHDLTQLTRYQVRVYSNHSDATPYRQLMWRNSYLQVITHYPTHPTHQQPQSSVEKVKPGYHLPTYQVTTYKATPHYHQWRLNSPDIE